MTCFRPKKINFFPSLLRPLIAALLVFSFCTAPVPETVAGRKILAREQSPYATITVSEADGKRYISIGGQEQSAVDLTDKRQLVYKYTYLLSLAVLAHSSDNPGRPLSCLVIGLGGGSFADFLADTFPQWKIRVVEIDPVIIRLAQRFFPIHPRITITEADGRVFLKNAREKYDIIVMDAFGENFIPPELYTFEFFTLMKDRLNPRGMVLMNAWENAMLDARERATLRAVFAKGYYLHHPDERPGNRIYLLAGDIDAAPVVKSRIAAKFTEYRFPGEAPQPVLAEMQTLHTGLNSAAPITDANVHALLRHALQN